jgi:hypothetical protein
MARFHEPGGWMLRRVDVAGLRFAAGERGAHHSRHLQQLGRCQVFGGDRNVSATAMWIGVCETENQLAIPWESNVGALSAQLA